MRVRYRSEADGWTSEGAKITSPENLGAIRRALDEEGPILVVHWHYRGASAPDRLIFHEYDEFTAYLGGRAYAGDAIDVWSIERLCTPENRIAEGKCPDDEGLVPRTGPY